MAAITKAKIRAVAYDSKSIQDDTIVDENTFASKGQFLLLSNRAIPKNSKVYIEVTITSDPNNRDIRHIPLCLGVHKEPSFGVLGSDCSLGAIYYTRNAYVMGPDTSGYLSFCIRDKYAGQLMQYRYERDTGGRVPIRKTVIGLGVDMVNNTISIYTDGVLFYSWTPSLFVMNDENEFYFAIYCSEPNEYVSGTINFGRYRTKYLPVGYMDMYQELYDKTEVEYGFESSLTVPSLYDYTSATNLFHGTIDMQPNELAPIVDRRREITLVCNHPDSMVLYENEEEGIINYHGFTYLSENTEEPDYAYIQQPIGQDRRIYFEFHSANATMNENQMGIPITIGITKDPNDLSKESYRIELFHLRTDGYHLYTVKDGFEFLEGNYNILNPTSPVQPNEIGVLLDLDTNTITIYTDGTPFTILQPNELADFSDLTEPVYFFFKAAPDRFTGTGYVICNFGTRSHSQMGAGDDHPELQGYYDPDLKWSVWDNQYIMTLWWYYNFPLAELYYRDIPCTAKIISDHIPYSKYITSTITIPEARAVTKGWSPGLNRLYGSYNKVTETEDRNNTPTISIYDLKKKIESDKEDNTR